MYVFYDQLSSFFKVLSRLNVDGPTRIWLLIGTSLTRNQEYWIDYGDRKIIQSEIFDMKGVVKFLLYVLKILILRP